MYDEQCDEHGDEDINVSRVFSEVYSVVIALGEDIVSRVASDVWEVIVTCRDTDYQPIIHQDKRLDEHELLKETFDMIVLLHLEYWCDDDEERDALVRMINENTRKYWDNLWDNLDNGLIISLI